MRTCVRVCLAAAVALCGAAYAGEYYSNVDYGYNTNAIGAGGVVDSGYNTAGASTFGVVDSGYNTGGYAAAGGYNTVDTSSYGTTGYVDSGYNTGYNTVDTSSYGTTGYVDSGYNTGYAATNYNSGYSGGYTANAGYNTGYNTNYNTGYANTNYNAGYNTGYNTGNAGYNNAGYNNNAGYTNANYNAGYNTGYNVGYAPPPTYGANVGSRRPAVSRGRAYRDDYAGYSAYEWLPVHQVFATIMHRTVRLKKREAGSPSDVRYAPTSFAIGYIHSRDRWQYGGAFNFEGGNRKINDWGARGFKVRTNIPGLSGFATYRPFQDSTYLSGSMFLGFASYKGKDAWLGGWRSPDNSSEHRTLFSLGFEAGHTWTLAYDIQLTPHIGLDYAYAPSESYNFAGLRAGIKSQSYWEIPFGATVRKTFAFGGGWLITPKFDLTLTPSVGRIDPKNAHPGFAYRVADKWKVVGASGSNMGARMTFGVDARFRERMAMGLEYVYEGRSKYNDHRIAANFRFAF